MRFRLPMLALAGMLLLPQAASAQTVITYEDAVRIALDQNVALRRAQNSLELQATSLSQARAARLPNLNFSTSTGRNWGLQFDLTTGRLETSSSDRFSLSASSGVTLFDGFAMGANVDQAEAALEAQEFSLENSKQATVLAVGSEYLQVFLDQQQIRIQEENLAAQQQQLERIVEFVRVGQRPISDQYVQEVQVANAEASLLTAQRSLQLSESRLINTLQLDPLESWIFQAPSPDDIELTLRSYNPDELLRTAYAQRQDLKASEFLITAAEAGITVAKSSRLPRVSLSAGASTSYSSFGRDPLTGQTASFDDQLADNRSRNIGLNLSLPIFNRFQTRNSVERAQVQLSNARLDLENIRQSIALDVRQAYLDYQTAVKRLEVTEKQVQSARQALEVEQARYDVASSTLVELTQARASFVDAESQRLSAIAQFYFQQTLIEFYLGALSADNPLF